ncbi:MAG: hypothetical protein LQ352_007689 [Teloschistes flavicans]|nr:MAG: hypothetical protein LQ352_007689 [Teloschistes flavicans]
MLLRSEFFLTMFSSAFREAQPTPHLQIIPIGCSPTVLEAVLAFLYTEKADFGLDVAIDVLFAADLLLIERLKQKAAVVISTLGNGPMRPASDLEIVGSTNRTDGAAPSSGERKQRKAEARQEKEEEDDDDDGGEEEEPDQEEPLDIYETIRAAWTLRVPRLEEFGARYLAYRLEHHIDSEAFAELIRESAGRLRARQETDSIELLDDVRYYLSERFRLRFEEAGLEEMLDEGGEEEEEDGGGKEGGGLGEEEELAPPRSVRDDEEEVEEDAVRPLVNGAIRTLDGEIAGDEFAGDAINYQILLGKIDGLLEKLRLDA